MVPTASADWGLASASTADAENIGSDAVGMLPAENVD